MIPDSSSNISKVPNYQVPAGMTAGPTGAAAASTKAPTRFSSTQYKQLSSSKLKKTGTIPGFAKTKNENLKSLIRLRDIFSH